jgi:RNA polymerase sigma-70 factor (ECF subfamily)
MSVKPVPSPAPALQRTPPGPGERIGLASRQRARPVRAGRSEESPPESDAGAGASPRSNESLDFEEVYREQFDFAWRSLRLLGVAQEALEDAAQDVFSVVSRQLSEFGGRASLRTWVFAIVQRTASNYRRRHRRKVKPLVPLGDLVAGEESTPQFHAEAAEAADSIERYCESLDPERRALFVLALLEDVPAPEIARALGVSVNTVYSRVRSLRTGLARVLQGGEEDHE